MCENTLFYAETTHSTFTQGFLWREKPLDTYLAPVMLVNCYETLLGLHLTNQTLTKSPANDITSPVVRGSFKTISTKSNQEKRHPDFFITTK